MFIDGELFILHVLEDRGRPLDVPLLTVAGNEALIRDPVRLETLGTQFLQEFSRVELFLVFEIHSKQSVVMADVEGDICTYIKKIRK